jgi:AraC-like DNA-binding protein
MSSDSTITPVAPIRADASASRYNATRVEASLQRRGLRIELRKQVGDVVFEPAIAQHCWHVHVGNDGEIVKCSDRANVDGAMLPKCSTFVPAGSAVGWHGGRDVPRMVLCLQADGFDASPPGASETNFRESAPVYDSMIDHFIGLLCEEWNPGSIPSDGFLDAFATMLFSYARYRHGTVPKTAQASDGMAALDRFIDAHIAETMSLERMAKAIDCSVYQLTSLVNQRAQTTPYRYVLRRRIRHAKRLLSEGRLTLIDVALSSGFSSQAHFTTAFGRTSGMTPGEFSKMLMLQRTKTAHGDMIAQKAAVGAPKSVSSAEGK